jgi:hypothetical protein
VGALTGGIGMVETSGVLSLNYMGALNSTGNVVNQIEKATKGVKIEVRISVFNTLIFFYTSLYI